MYQNQKQFIIQEIPNDNMKYWYQKPEQTFSYGLTH